MRRTTGGQLSALLGSRCGGRVLSGRGRAARGACMLRPPSQWHATRGSVLLGTPGPLVPLVRRTRASPHARSFATAYDQPFIRVSRHTKDENEIASKDKQKHNRPKRALMFPGQGTQFVGMGSDLAKEFPEARKVFAEVDEALGFFLSRIMWDGAPQELTLTENAQPAILAHSIAVFRVLQKELGIAPPRGYASLLGYSLGEWSAICASGALPLWDTIRLVHYRGKTMQEAVPLGEGSMVALMPTDLPTAQKIATMAAESTGATCQVANINSPKQIVLSGASDAVDKAIDITKQEFKRIKLIQKLNVSAPFHCAMMRPAADKLKSFIEDPENKIKFANPLAPIISNVTARPITRGDEFLELEFKQVTDAVQWLESVRLLAYPATAINTSQEDFLQPSSKPAWKEVEESERLWQYKGFDDFLELGPGKTLSGFIRQIDSQLSTSSVGTVQDVIDYCKSYHE